MQTVKVEILLIEGSPSEADHIRAMLAESGRIEFSVQHVQGLAEGLRLLRENKFDVILVDLGLPDSQGPETALTVRREAKRTPVVALTVLDDEETALGLLSLGIQDYLLKCEITGPLLSRAIRYAIQRKRDSESLRESEERFTSFMLHLSAAAWIKDLDGRYIYANARAESVFSTPLSVLLGNTDEEVFPPETAREFRKNDQRACAEGGSLQTTEMLLQADGIEHHSIVSKFAIPDPDGKPAYVAGIALDITELMRAKQALRESQERFSKIFDTAPVGITISTMEDGRFVDINEEGERLSGYRRAEVVGRTALQFDIWKDPAERASMLEEIRSKGVVRDREMALRDKKGSVLRGLFSAVVIDIRGKKHLLSIVSDITERKQTEEALANSERFLKAIVDTEPECIKLLDSDCNLLMMNQAGLDLIEADSFEQVKGQCVCPLVIPSDRDAFISLVKQVFEGTPGTLEFELVGIKGRHVWLDTHAVPFRNEQGEIVSLLGITRDVTGRKRAEEERLNLEKQILHAQKLESLGVLAGGIAHDFNNILMAIIGNTDLALARLSEDAPAVDNLRRIMAASKRAAELTQQMLAYSGKGRFVVEIVDLNRLLESMRHLLEVSISKNATLKLDLQHHLPPMEADATQVSQIVMNLVINASEAIGDADGVITITTGCRDCDRNYLQKVWQDEQISEGLYLYLEIADTGCGMDEVTMAKMFDPFFTTKFTGRGLGMAAVLGIIKGHKGSIKICSTKGKGTTFKLLLPASKRAADLLNQDSHATRDICDGATDGHLGRGKILLVDDEEEVRGIGAEMLRELGFTPITANDGVDAIRIFKENPDLAFVILDLTMPRMDGVQCFRWLRRLDPKIKVVMSSGYNEQDIAEKIEGMELSGFIQKPYNLSALKDMIRRVAGII